MVINIRAAVSHGSFVIQRFFVYARNNIFVLDHVTYGVVPVDHLQLGIDKDGSCWLRHKGDVMFGQSLWSWCVYHRSSCVIAHLFLSPCCLRELSITSCIKRLSSVAGLVFELCDELQNFQWSFWLVGHLIVCTNREYSATITIKQLNPLLGRYGINPFTTTWKWPAVVFFVKLLGYDIRNLGLTQIPQHVGFRFTVHLVLSAIWLLIWLTLWT